MTGKLQPEASETQQGQGNIASDVRGAALQAARHVESMAQLLHIELQEYARFQMRRVALIAVGSVLLLCAYALLCILGVELIRTYTVIPEEWALAAMVGFNALIGLVLLCIGIMRKPEGLAPATGREFMNDIQCIKLYLQGKGKS